MIAVAIPTMNADCPVGADASRPVGTGRAGSGVGFGDLKAEQAENEQSGSNCLHITMFPSSSMVLTDEGPRR
jgi:hypothetical protein